MDFNKRKFLSLPAKRQHTLASRLLAAIAQGEEEKIPLYQEIEKLLLLSPISLKDYELISARYHAHLERASLCKQEHSLLYVKTEDSSSLTPFLPIHIYLCSLRSAFNVGSILRTTEAFRLGTVHFGKTTPTIENPKVQKASMGTHLIVPTKANTPIESLPRPWIALETAHPSTPITSFRFPSICTLFLGNEEFGIPKDLLKACNSIVEIPLVGAKNSLNVASAFAVAAHQIRSQI